MFVFIFAYTVLFIFLLSFLSTNGLLILPAWISCSLYVLSLLLIAFVILYFKSISFKNTLLNHILELEKEKSSLQKSHSNSHQTLQKRVYALSQENARLKASSPHAISPLPVDHNNKKNNPPTNTCAKLLAENDKLINQMAAMQAKHTSEMDLLQKRIHDLDKHIASLETHYTPRITSDSNELLQLRAENKRLRSIDEHQHELLSKKWAAYEHQTHLEYELASTQKKLSALLDAYPTAAAYLEHYDHTQKMLQSAADPAQSFLRDEEYESLSPSERDQLALDRYISSRKKTLWQIGRDYELSVGHEFMRNGYRVSFNGSSEKFNDLGLDLIAQFQNKTYLVQCKYWDRRKTIQEKYIAQFYGSCVYYTIDHPYEIVTPVFVTNSTFSPMARRFAAHLGVKLVSSHSMSDFPRIKCNIGHDAEGGTTMIYHLPYDPQYDRVKIDTPGECWASTIEEAESYGFRRAQKN